jgi:hypothetical protein
MGVSQPLRTTCSARSSLLGGVEELQAQLRAARQLVLCVERGRTDHQTRRGQRCGIPGIRLDEADAEHHGATTFVEQAGEAERHDCTVAPLERAGAGEQHGLIVALQGEPRHTIEHHEPERGIGLAHLGAGNAGATRQGG